MYDVLIAILLLMYVVGGVMAGFFTFIDWKAAYMHRPFDNRARLTIALAAVFWPTYFLLKYDFRRAK